MSHTNLTVYGATWCSDCKRAKKFLGEQRVHYNWVDVEQDAEGLALVERINNGKRLIPTIVFDNESTLVEPSNAELAAKLGLQTRAKMDYYDLVCVGGGPTSLTAALYAAREGLDVLVIEKSGLGGQAGVTERLDNFPGFPEGIGLRAEAESRYITTADGREYGARAILVATGSTYRRLGVPGEDDLIGAGVHFCATCDGPFYKGRYVAVNGGGNSAGEESLFLTRFADKVTILVRGEQMTASKIVIDKIAETPQVEVRYNTEVTELLGENKLTGLTIRDRQTGATEQIHPAGAFVFIGLSPNSGWLPAEIRRDPYGFVETNATLETSMAGVFAAGDVRKGSTKQAASAAGE